MDGGDPLSGIPHYESNNASNDVSESVAINFRQSNNLCIFVKGTKLKASDREKNYKMMYTKFIQ